VPPFVPDYTTTQTVLLMTQILNIQYNTKINIVVMFQTHIV